MSTCWRCGREVAHGKNECDYGCPSRMSAEDTEKFAQCLERLAMRRRIDWSKVRTFDDLLCVFSTLFGDASVEPDSALAKKLERFLEPKKQD
jgi:hypothetical protein